MNNVSLFVDVFHPYKLEIGYVVHLIDGTTEVEYACGKCVITYNKTSQEYSITEGNQIVTEYYELHENHIYLKARATITWVKYYL